MKNDFEQINTKEMIKKIDLMQNPSDMEGFWTVDAFKEAYPEKPALTGCAIASVSEEVGNPDKMAIATLRTFIENGNRAKDDQKYVVGIRFYSMGDMATIDVISMDKGFHKEIAYEHLKRMGWPSINEQTGKPINHLDETSRTPFAFVGGHLYVKDGEKTNLTGSSGDYGNSIFFSDSNAIAAYAASACGIEVTEGDKEKGEAFVQEILEFMLKHKMQPDFYEQFAKYVFEKTGRGVSSLTSQHIGALMTMKAADRAISENKDMMQAMVDELAGFSRFILVNGIAEKVKEAKEV